MDTSNLIHLTVYLVGTDEHDALANMPFDSPDSAEKYQSDNPGTRVFSVTASIDPSTIEEESE